MKAGDAKGVPVQMKWLNASDVWKPAPRPRRRGRGRLWAWSRNCSRARSPAGPKRSVPPRGRLGAEEAGGLLESLTALWRVECMRRSWKDLQRARLERVYKGETDRVYIDHGWGLPNPEG